MNQFYCYKKLVNKVGHSTLVSTSIVHVTNLILETLNVTDKKGKTETTYYICNDEVIKEEYTKSLQFVISQSPDQKVLAE